MSRDRIKNDKYFEEYIIEQNKRIAKFQLVANQQDDIEKKTKLYRIVANLQKDLFSAKYSIGANIEELRRIFDDYLESLKKTSVSDYGELVDLISIGILLDTDINNTINKCDLSLKKDGLVEALLNDGKIGSMPLLFEDYYSPFYMYLKKEKDISYLEEYMENSWYSNSAEFSWYDSDTSKENVYVGYWCWIAAAVIKLRGDKVNNKNNYLPVDLL